MWAWFEEHIFAPALDSFVGTTALVFATIVVGSALIIVPLTLIVGDEGRADFMAECGQHRPKYECTAMWRAGNASPAPAVMPMPIVVPGR